MRQRFAAPAAEMGDVWRNTNSDYGAHYGMAYSEPASPRRPSGCDIGSSRPWPHMNEGPLAPRVPISWMLESRPQNERPTVPALMSLVQSGHGKGFALSSLRDVSRGYSSMISQTMKPRAPMQARPSSVCDAWWSLGRAGDAYGPYDLRPSQYPMISDAMARREAGAAARQASKG